MDERGFALAADQHVTWDLEEGAAGGTITADGLYTAPSTTGTFHVRATCVLMSEQAGKGFFIGVIFRSRDYGSPLVRLAD